MERGTCGRSVRLGAGVAVLLTYASAAGAFDAAAYYPLQSNSRWTYDVESRLTIASGTEGWERYLTGSSEEVVIGPSPLSKVGSTVYKVRSRIQLGELDSEPIINESFTTHLSAHKEGVLVHGVDSTVFPYPSLLLTADPRLNETVEFSVEVMDEVPTINELLTIKQLGKLHMRVALTSQTNEGVRVPAGKYRKVVKLVYRGSAHGKLGGGYSMRFGTVTATTWYAKGVGLVRSHTAYYFKVRAPDGKSVAMTESETYQLIRFEP